MAKYSFKFKKNIVKEYLDGNGSSHSLAKKYKIGICNSQQVLKWINAYAKFGDKVCTKIDSIIEKQNILTKSLSIVFVRIFLFRSVGSKLVISRQSLLPKIIHPKFYQVRGRWIDIGELWDCSLPFL